MQIFILDRDPVRSAQMQCDRHVVKQAVESAQILATALWMNGVPAPYKPAYRHHPCTQWASRTRSNWEWLKTHGLALCEEFTARYGKRHASQDPIEAMDGAGIPEGPLEEFAQAMPDQYKVPGDAVAAYQAYYAGEKCVFADGKPATWRLREIPEFLRDRIRAVG
jgi:hypothetical protein